ncbi:ATP-dependent nuclease [Bacillus mobilis]|uniref:ATP-dependent nuclease n=1 Tax=Bacillus mobilis TaxID=2026190 RepID=UPI003677076F
MILKHLYIKNFRNIKDVWVDNLKDVNLFIGKNNIGKSNYLRAVRCFFSAIESQSIYKKDILKREDIMSGNDAEDLLLMGVLENNGQWYVASVGCKIIDKEVYTYHCIIYSHRLGEKKLQGIPAEYQRSFDLYSEYIERFLENIHQIKIHNKVLEKYKRDIEHVSALEIDLKVEEIINVHKYIEDNLNLSDETMILLKKQNIDMDNIQKFIISKLEEMIDMYDQSIESFISEITQVEKEIKFAWEYNLDEINIKTIRYQNENIVINQGVISGIKTMFQAEKKEAINFEDAKRIFSLKNRKESVDVWLNLKEMCRRVLDIEIDVFLNRENQPIIDIGNNWININGTGIKEVFRIILDIELLNPQIILIEEPEIHLHFELQQRLSEYLQLKAKNAQVFITSHSTAFVEETHNKSVYLIKRKEEKENSIQLLDSESLDEIISELGFNAQALLIKKMLIFVEGKTDKVIVDTYLQKFHPHMLSKIGCIDMKGETKYKYFANAEALEIFEKSGVETFFILDSDYKTQDEKGRKISQHPEKSSLFFWPGVCIENLFLNPVVLGKFITAKDETKRKELDEIDEIMKKTYADIKIDSSRKYIREKYLKAIYPEKSSKDSVDDTDSLKAWFNEKRTKMREELELEVDIDSIVEEFDVLWGNKLDEVVPGDKFLIKFCENIGNLTYKKNEKNVRYLIEDLSQEEWPSGFTQIMKEIIQKANNRVLESV